MDWAIRYAWRGQAWSACGIRIRVRLVKGDGKPYAEQVAKALAIIERYDPLRLARMRRDIDGILVSALVTPGATAQYHHDYGLCMLDGTTILNRHPAFAALSIVHEATHARLAAITATGENINRIERICTAQELAFAQRLPGTEPLQEWLRERVARTHDADFSLRGRVARGFAALEEEGVPKPVLAVLHGMARHAGHE
jgi:hypothetical protein